MRHTQLVFATTLMVLMLLFPSISIGQTPYPVTPQIAIDPPDQIVIKFKDDPTGRFKTVQGKLSTGIARLDNLNTKYEVTGQKALLTRPLAASRSNPLKNVYILTVPPGKDLEAMAREYEKLEEVEYAHPDGLFELFELPNDSLLSHQWALNNSGQLHYHVERLDGFFNDTLALVSGTPGADIHAGQVFENPPDQTDVVIVAIIDTGVDVDHPDLAGMIWSNSLEIADNGLDDDHNGYVDDTHGWDFSGNDVDIYPIYEDNDPNDYVGHGTHCAGIVAAVGDNSIGVAGVVPGVVIMPVKIFPAAIATVSAAAIVYAVDNGADVISMSWGGNYSWSIVDDALIYAHNKGVVLVAASGNSGYIQCLYPSCSPYVMSVTATDHFDHVTTFSTVSDHTSVCAPGMSVLSLRGAGTDMYSRSDEPNVHIIEEQYYLASGTSMACPHAAGVAAYVRSVSSGLEPDQVQAIVENSADDFVDPYGAGWDYPGWDIYSGYGRVNLAASLDATPRTRAIISSPWRNTILDGTVDIYGSADGVGYTSHILEYTRSTVDTQWVEIASASTPVTDGLLGTLFSSGLDGPITLRLRVGDTNRRELPFYISNEIAALLIEPSDYDTTNGIAAIKAQAYCPEFAYSLLEYGVTANPSTWEVIDTVYVPAFGEVMYAWPTTTLLDGIYSLRLSVFSGSGLQAVDTTVFVIISPFAGDNGWSITLDSLAGRCANYGDFDNDGENEIVIGTYAGVQFFNLDGSPKISGVPVFPAGDYRAPLAVGDLDGDGVDDIVGIGYRDSVLYGFPSTAPAFEVTLPMRSTSVYLKDIDNDGLDEIHVRRLLQSGAARPTYYALYRPDGTEWGHGFPMPEEYTQCFPADLDGDMIAETYCYSDSSHYLVQFDTLGQAVDSLLVEADGLGLISNLRTFSAIDIDGDLIHELILFGWSTSDPWDPGSHNNFQVFAFDENLQLIEGWPHDTGLNGYGEASELVFGDLDGDGELEYVTKFNIDFTFNYLYAWHLDGSPYLGDSAQNGVLAGPQNPNKLNDPVLVDANDDGNPNVLLSVSKDFFSTYPAERMIAYDVDGLLVENFPLVVQYPTTGMIDTRGVPTAGDINKDGFLDFVYPWHDKLMFINFPGVDYYPDRAPWPMHRHNRRQNATTNLTGETVYECGDINGSGGPPNIADLVYLVDYMFVGGPPPPDLNLADVDGSGGDLDISDLVYLVDYMFNGGPTPVCP